MTNYFCKFFKQQFYHTDSLVDDSQFPFSSFILYLNQDTLIITSKKIRNFLSVSPQESSDENTHKQLLKFPKVPLIVLGKITQRKCLLLSNVLKHLLYFPTKLAPGRIKRRNLDLLLRFLDYIYKVLFTVKNILGCTFKLIYVVYNLYKKKKSKNLLVITRSDIQSH